VHEPGEIPISAKEKKDGEYKQQLLKKTYIRAAQPEGKLQESRGKADPHDIHCPATHHTTMLVEALERKLEDGKIISFYKTWIQHRAATPLERKKVSENIIQGISVTIGDEKPKPVLTVNVIAVNAFEKKGENKARFRNEEGKFQIYEHPCRQISRSGCLSVTKLSHCNISPT